MALEIRDPIHGFIQRSNREQKIIDTKLFQRLRGIKQLALASLVYPGALHTRFEHCIGAMHIAGRVAEKLGLSSEEKEILRLSALLHDIGHGPFSHVSEDVLEHLSGRKKIHEEITARIISTHEDLNGPLSGCDREEIVGLLEGKRRDSILRAILSGPLDVDKQDYLLRDSYFCGVKYGVYDLDRLLETLCIRSDKGDRFLAIHGDGVQALEQFVIARYHMTGQVYRHRVRLITDSMIVRAITLGIEEDGIGWLQRLYTYKDSEDFLRNYLSWDDGRLIREILDDQTPSGYAKSMFDRLLRRDLFKEVFGIKLRDLELLPRQAVLSADKGRALALTTAIEKAVADSYKGLDEHFVIARIVTQKSAAQTEGSILVVRPDGSVPVEFREESILFASIDTAIQEQYLALYCPMEWNDDADKRKKKEQFAKELTPLINDVLKTQTGLFPMNSKGDK